MLKLQHKMQHGIEAVNVSLFHLIFCLQVDQFGYRWIQLIEKFSLWVDHSIVGGLGSSTCTSAFSGIKLSDIMDSIEPWQCEQTTESGQRHDWIGH